MAPNSEDLTVPAAPPSREQFGDVLQAIRDSKIDSLKRADVLSRDRSPDHWAKVLEISQKTRFSPEYVSRNLEEMTKDAARVPESEYARAVREAPKTASWLTDPDNLAIARDSIDKIAELEKKIYRMTGPLRDLTPAEFDDFAKTAADARAEEYRQGRRAMIQDNENAFTLGENPVVSPDYKQAQAAAEEDAVKNAHAGFLAEEMDQLRAEQAFISGEGKAGIAESFWRSSKESPGGLLPFIGAIPQGIQILRLREARTALDEGTATPYQKQLLIRTSRLKEAAVLRGQTVPAQIAETVANLFPVGVEFALTGGVYSLGKEAVLKAGESYVKGKLSGLALRAAASTAGGLLQTVAKDPLKIANRILEATGPGVTLDNMGQKAAELAVVIDNPGDDFLPALYNAFGREAVENISERTGFILEKSVAPLKAAILTKWLRLNPEKGIVGAIDRLAHKSGWNGMIGEMFEERVGEFARAGLGLEAYSPPSLEQLVVEAASFSVPGLFTAGVGRLARGTPLQPASNPEFFKMLRETVETSKVFERSPERAEAHLAEVLRDTHAELTYIPTEKWIEFCQLQKDENGVPFDPNAVATEVTGDTKAFKEAVTTGHLVIPTARYAVEIAPTELGKALEQYAKTHPLEQNAEEAKEESARRKSAEAAEPATTQKTPAETQTAQPTASALKPSEPGAVGKAFTKMMSALGLRKKAPALKDLTQSGIEKYGAVFEASYRERAKLRGVTPEALFAEENPTLGMASEKAEAGALEQGKKPAPTFYSKLQKTLEEKMPASAPVEQVKGIIKDLKPEEREWSGIDVFLAGKDKVGKQELLDHLRGNEVKVEEVVKGDLFVTPEAKEIDRKARESLAALDEFTADMRLKYNDFSWFSEATEAEKKEHKALADEAVEFQEQAINAGKELKESAARFSKHTLPGGENYRELLLTLPENASAGDKAKQQRISELTQRRDELQAKMDSDDVSLDRSDLRRQITNTEMQLEMVSQRKMNDPAAFRSSHFDEPNILAHVRFNERKDTDGNRVLFIEEIQSDWHQKGKKQGYGTDTSAIEKEQEAYEESLVEKYGTEAWRPKADTLEKAYWDELSQKIRDGESGVPDAPFKKTWPELALKRMIRYASENGFDKIAWTTGEQQAERYDLSKQVDAIHYSPDRQELLVVKKGESGADPIASGVTWENLADYVGKEAAKKLKEGPERGGYHFIKGPDLKVGGEGMKGFYDQILPAVANKIGKKYGAKVGETEIVTGNATPEAMRLAEERGNETFLKANGPISIHSFDITPALRDVAMNEGFPLFQGEGDIRKGVYIPARVRAAFTKYADYSTPLHELAHFWLDMSGRDVAFIRNLDQATLNPEQQGYLKRVDDLLEHLGAKDLGNLTRAQHEKFAEEVEVYFATGKAPSRQLLPVFRQLKEWLLALWGKIGQQLHAAPAVANFMDRLLASEQEVAIARATQNLDRLFPDPKAVGMTDAQAEKYAEVLDRADEARESRLQEKALEAVVREKEKWWNEESEKVKIEIAREVNGRREYIAAGMIENGQAPGGGPKTDPMKLSREAVKEYGDVILSTIPKGMVVKEGGITPDAAAEILGFTSGDHLLKVLGNLENREALIERMTNERMREIHGDVFADGRLQEEAMKAVHTADGAKALHWELKWLASNEFAAFKGMAKAIARQPRRIEEYAKEAKDEIRGKKVRDITPALYQRAEQKAGREAVDLFFKGDIPGAFEAKERQLMNHERYRAAVEAQDDLASIVKYMRRFGQLLKRQQLALAGKKDYLDPIDSITERYEFKRVSDTKLAERESLKAWVARQTLETGIEPEVPEHLLAEAQRINFRDATFGELEEARDTVKRIDHLATLKNKLLAAKDKREFDAAVTASAEEINKAEKRPNELGSLSYRDAALDRLDSFITWQRKLSFVVRQLDGGKDGGPTWEVLVRPFNDAATREGVMFNKAGTELKKAWSVYSVVDMKKMYTKHFFPDLNYSLSHMDRLCIALNCGNADNLQKLMDGYGWSREAVQSVLDTLDARDIAVVNATWDHLESYWPEIKGLAERIEGIAPEKVEATPVTAKAGTLKGGYYPLKYSGDIMVDAKEAAQRALRGAYIRSTTKSGHRKARIEGVQKKIRLEPDVFTGHIQNVIHDLTHYEALIDANRFLRDPRMTDAITSRYGDRIYRKLVADLDAIAAGNVQSRTAGERIANHIRIGTSVSIMGYRAVTAAKQPLGLFQGMVRVGPTWIARGIGRMVGDAAHMESTAKWCREKFPWMAARDGNQQREISEIRNQLKLTGKFSVIQDLALWHIGKMQQLTDMPIAIGAYQKALAELGYDKAANSEEAKRIDDKAAALAEQAVLDSQGGGLAKDLADVQRGGAYLKFLSMFYTFANTRFNQLHESVSRTKSVKDVPRLAADLLTMYTLPAMVAYLAGRVLIGGGGDDDDEPIPKGISKEVVSEALGDWWGFREFAGAVKGYRYSGPPGTRIVDTVINLSGQIGQGEVDEGLLRAGGTAAGIILHLPSGQVDATLRGIMALDDEPNGNPIQVLTGPPPRK